MPPAPVCPNEPQRLQALHSLGILDTPPTSIFDSFVRVARGLFDTPIAAISLVDRDRQWFKASEGLAIRETHRDVAFCAHAILQPDHVLCVPDARRDSRFADNPLVTRENGIRFYAGAPLVDEDGNTLGALCVVDRRPRTPDMAALARLQDLATGVMAALRLHGTLRRAADEARCDPLTGLPNRRAFDEALQALGRRAATLFLLDLDNFRSFNDIFGHGYADAVLREVARRLRFAVPPEHRMFRVGGDAFAVLADGPHDDAAALAVAARMHAALADPFVCDGDSAKLCMSIGIAGMPTHAKRADRLFHAVDAALTGAKRAGRGTSRLAQPWARRTSRNADPGMGRVLMKEVLREALRAPLLEQFGLHFQPVLDLQNGCVVAHEALVRWELPDGRRVSPADFVPAAEECGLIGHLDSWVLQQACVTATQWPTPWHVSVNMSPVTIARLDAVALVRDALDRTALDPDRLVIEVTETAAVADPDQMVRTIEGLRRLGVVPIIDDFGSGNASFAYLRQYPFRHIKTDRCFVEGLGRDARAAPVMEAVARLARSLDMMVIAEGVETEEQLAILHRLGVPRVQGFLLGRPVPADQVLPTAERAERLLARALRRQTGRAGRAARLRNVNLGQPGWPPDVAYREPALA